MNPSVEQLLEAHRRGRSWDPSYPNLANLDEGRIRKMNGSERDARDLMASLQQSDLNMELFLRGFHPDRQGTDSLLYPDGDVGPATESLLRLDRCPIPDFAPPPGASFHYDDPVLQKVVESYQEAKFQPATGSGSFPPGCHGTKFNPDGEKVHEVTISYDLSKAPAKVKEWWPEIRRRSHQAVAWMGVRLIEVPVGEPAMIKVSWRVLAGSTIGLAQFNSRNCGGSVFCYLDPGYAPDLEMVLLLLLHENGHNWNFEHSRGFIMNPSILRVKALWVEWNADFTQKLYEDVRYQTNGSKFFGDRPVTPHGDLPGPTPGPTPTPTPGPKLLWRPAPNNSFEVVAQTTFVATAGEVVDRFLMQPYPKA